MEEGGGFLQPRKAFPSIMAVNLLWMGVQKYRLNIQVEGNFIVD